MRCRIFRQCRNCRRTRLHVHPAGFSRRQGEPHFDFVTLDSGVYRVMTPGGRRGVIISDVGPRHDNAPAAVRVSFRIEERCGGGRGSSNRLSPGAAGN